MDRISVLSNKLNRLRRLDRGLDVHGASEHRYKTHPLTRNQIEQIERAAGNPLPNELREWLLRVGFGVGPSYGLFRMGERKWFEGWLTLKASLGVWTSTPEEPPGVGEFRSLSEIGLKEAQQKVDETIEAPRTEQGFPECGPPEFTTKSYLGGSNILTLSHDGCSFWYVTPLTGPLKGKIFLSTEETTEEVDGQHIDRAGVFWLQGIVRNDSHQWFDGKKAIIFEQLEDAFGFLDWIEYWLDREIYLVSNLDRYKEQVVRSQEELRKHSSEQLTKQG